MNADIFKKKIIYQVIAVLLILVPVTAIAAPPPFAIIEKGAVTVTGGDTNGNGIIENAQDGKFKVTLNSSSYSLNKIFGVTANLTTSNTGISIIDGSATYGDIDVGTSKGPIDEGFIVRVPGQFSGGTVSFGLQISYKDADGTSYMLAEPIPLSITIEKINHAPVLTPIGNKTVNEGSLLQFSLSAADLDGNTLTYSASNLPSGATFNTSTKTFSWTPSYTQAGTYAAVHFQVSDGYLKASEDITITVTNINRAPVLAAIGNKTVAEAQALTFTISATDADGNTLTYSASNLPSGATFNASTRAFSWTPSYTQAGTYAGVHFEVSDGLAKASEDITITVTNVNRAPVLAAIGNKSTIEGQKLEFIISATDPDNQPLTYSASNMPAGAVFNATTRTFSWTPGYDRSGVYYNIYFEVRDGSLKDSEYVDVTVTNGGFTISTNTSSRTITQGSSTTYTVSLKSIGMYNSPVTLSVNSITPSPGPDNPISWSFSANPVTPASTAVSTTLNIATSRATPPQAYTVEIVGRDSVGFVSKSVSLTVSVSSFNGSISGKTYKKGTNSYTGSAVVQAREQFGGWYDRSYDTSSYGSYKIVGLAPGTYYIYGKLAGYGTAIKTNIPVNSGKDTPYQHLYFSTVPGWVYGTVKNTAQEVLENVYVWLGITGTNGVVYWIGTYDYTDSGTGYYELKNLDSSNSYQVKVEGSTKGGIDYAAMVNSNVTVLDSQGTAVNFILQRAARIYGTVKDAYGAPIKDVKVKCWAQGVDISGNAVTDQSGNYSIRYLLPGYNYTVQFTPPSSTTYIVKKISQSVTSAADYPLNAVLASGSIKITGNVKAQATQQPVMNIKVRYRNIPNDIYLDVYTNESGNYSITNLPKGNSEVSVLPDVTYAAAATTGDFQLDSVVNFELVAGSGVSGTVMALSTVQPVSNVSVQYYNSSLNTLKQTYTDSNGVFNFTGLPEGIAELSARPMTNTGFAWKQQYIYLGKAESKKGLRITLEKGALIAGYLKDANNNAISNQIVELGSLIKNDWRGRTDSSGVFIFRLPPAKRRIVVDDNSWIGRSQQIEIKSPADKMPVVSLTAYNLEDAANISGIVRNLRNYDSDVSYKVLALESGEELTAQTLDEIRPISASCGRETRNAYSLIVPPDKDYTLLLCLWNEARGIRSVTILDILRDVPAGVVNNDFRYDSIGGTITGIVRYNAQPVLMAQVYLEDINGNLIGFADTDQNGVYNLYKVPGGNYTISARHVDYGHSGPVPVENIEDNKTLKVDITISDTK